MVQPKRKIQEGFALNVEPEYRRSINAAFHKVLDRDAQEFEIQNYRSYMSTASDASQIEAKLKTSSEYKKRAAAVAEEEAPPAPILEPFEESEADKALAKRLSIYRSIVRVYERVLDRLPIMTELNYYYEKILADPNYDLELGLKASEEHRILEMNQTNRVNEELDGEITDAQLTLIVDEIYAEALPGKPLPVKEDQEFLKSRFVAYKLDRTRLKKLILFLNSMESSSDLTTATVTSTTATSSSTATSITSSSGRLSTTTASESNHGAPPAYSYSTVSNQLQGASPEMNDQVIAMDGNYGQDKDYVIASLMNPATSDKNQNKNKKGQGKEPAFPPLAAPDQCNQSYKLMSPDYFYNKNKFIDSFYENLSAAQQVDIDQVLKPCAAPTVSTTTRVQNGLAEIQNQRNMSEVKYHCDRNTYYLNQEAAIPTMPNDPNVVPSRLNTKFGTFLDDASQTTIGSIMPKFIYKEYV